LFAWRDTVRAVIECGLVVAAKQQG